MKKLISPPNKVSSPKTPNPNPDLFALRTHKEEPLQLPDQSPHQLHHNFQLKCPSSQEQQKTLFYLEIKPTFSLLAKEKEIGVWEIGGGKLEGWELMGQEGFGLLRVFDLCL